MKKFERKTKEERRKEIMQAAKEVFWEKGYRYATMEDIIKKTSLSKGGVYRYYKNTKSIMFDIMMEGNYFRYRRTEELLAELAYSDDICEVITKVITAKVFEDVPEKKLYVMFLSEIMYDKETEAYFYKLEDTAHKLILQNIEAFMEQKSADSETLKKKLSALTTIKKSKALLYSRIINGVLIIYELLQDSDVFKNNQDEIHDLIYKIVKNIIYNKSK